MSKYSTAKPINDTSGSLSEAGISSLNNAQILTYNSTSTKWTNSTLNFTSALSGDTDVIISNLSPG